MHLEMQQRRRNWESEGRRLIGELELKRRTAKREQGHRDSMKVILNAAVIKMLNESGDAILWLLTLKRLLD